MFPLPHGSAESVDQDHRLALTQVEICHCLAFDLHGMDRETLEGFEIGGIESGDEQAGITMTTASSKAIHTLFSILPAT